MSDDRDTAFERWLLEAARHDAPPPGATEQAWARFAADSARVASSSGLEPRAASASPSLGAKLPWLGAGLVVGGVLGALIAFELRAPAPPPLSAHAEQAPPPRAAAASDERAPAPSRSAHEAVPAPPRSEDEAAAPSPHAAASNDDAAAPAPRAPRETAAPPPRATAPARREKRSERTPPRARPRAASAEQSLAPARSTLALEVAALDAARARFAASSYADVLAAVDAFHRDFPLSQLGADAEALAIEALLARGDRAAAAARARRFLRTFPNDPHAARLAPMLEGAMLEDAMLEGEAP